MAVSPEKAKANITEQELKDMEVVEAHVDNFLMANYMGALIEIKLPLRISNRMANQLTKKYEQAGWKGVSFSQDIAKLTEYDTNYFNR